AAAFVEGATTAGADVVDLGTVSTDLVYFASGHLDAPAAVFTASHNPPQYNGIKPCRAQAAPGGIEGGVAGIKHALGQGHEQRGGRRGRVECQSVLGEFVRHVHSFVDVGALAPLRVVTDTANGVGGLVVPAVFADLPFEVRMLYAELDGTFPNHPAD